MKPLIGITTNFTRDGSTGKREGFGSTGQDYHLIQDEYTRCVERAGGIPVLIPSYINPETVTQMVDRLDGLLLAGGNDVDPNLYGQWPIPQLGLLTPQRDLVEISAVRHALGKTSISILGICRGMQIINVALGGTLYQDLEVAGLGYHSIDASPMNHPVHKVELADGSRLLATIGAKECGVNSFHHQAVNRVADGLVVTAKSADGVIEAVEHAGERYLLAVQWHPEMMCDSQIQQRIFRDFVAACRNGR